MRLLYGIAAWVSLVSAIQRDQVGSLDFHLPLLGPVDGVYFHRPEGEAAGSVCLARSSRNVLAAVHCGSGQVAWRHLLEEDLVTGDEEAEGRTDGLLKVIPYADKVISLSHAGRKLSSWQVQSGHNAWQLDEVTPLVDVATHEDGVFAVLALSQTGSVSSLDGETGQTVWSSRATGEVPIRVTSDAGKVFVLGLQGKAAVIDVFDGKTGKLQESFALPSRPANSADILAFENGVLLWRNGDRKIELNILGLSVVQPIQVATAFENVHAQTLRGKTGPTTLLLEFTSGSTRRSSVYAIPSAADKQSKVIPVYDIPALSTPSASTLTLHEDEVFVVRASSDASSSRLECWKANSHGRVLDSVIIGDLRSTGKHHVAVAAELSDGSDGLIARAMVSTSGGQFAMLQGDAVAWSTEQGIADARKVLFAQLQQHAALEAALNEQLSENVVVDFVARVRRHLAKLGGLIFGPGNVASKAGAEESDAFGLHQYVVAVGQAGQAWALDNADGGAVVWYADEVDPHAQFIDAWMTRSDEAAGAPILSTLLNIGSSSVLIQTDALSGRRLQTSRINEKADLGIVVDEGKAQTIVGVVGGKLELLSDTSHNAAILDSLKDLVLVRERAEQLDGLVVSDNELVPLWQVKLPGRLLATAQPQQGEAIASVGRVLGDRGVLYKLLSRKLLVAATFDDDTSTLIVHLIDTADGSILHTAAHANVSGTKPVRVVFSENWYTYHYWVNGQVHGYEVTISEVYVGARNEKVNLQGDKINVVSRSFLHDRGVRALGATTTLQGITTRDVLVAHDDGTVSALPRRLLDPRRPDTLTSSDKEEGLLAYEPALPLAEDNKLVLSHAYHILGARHFTVQPTLLESTALVAVSGLDIFATRVTPSMAFDILQKSFSKFGIIVSFVALAAATIVMRPMAAKKRLERQWQA
ncbi:hypothetical protein PYCC9005_001865 [Savitreella phatthalungensis]